MNILSDWWQTTQGSNVVSGDSAIRGFNLKGKEVLMVSRSGDVHDPILAGAPGNLQARYDGAQGQVIFDTATPFNQGETVFVMFKVICSC